jgi:hypothetical protein
MFTKAIFEGMFIVRYSVRDFMLLSFLASRPARAIAGLMLCQQHQPGNGGAGERFLPVVHRATMTQLRARSEEMSWAEVV